MATINEVIDAAAEAERKGVPVDWRDLCIKVARVSIERVQALEAIIESGDGSRRTDIEEAFNGESTE